MIATTAGSKFSIGPVATKDTDTLVEYTALTSYVEVGEVESLGEFGDEATAVTFLSVGDSRTRKLKGSRDAGTITLTVGRDPTDPGQNALRAAERTNFDFAFKIEANDAEDEDSTNSIFYFRGKVMSARDNLGGADDVSRTTFSIGINSSIVEDPSAPV